MCCSKKTVTALLAQAHAEGMAAAFIFCSSAPKARQHSFVTVQVHERRVICLSFYTRVSTVLHASCHSLFVNKRDMPRFFLILTGSNRRQPTEATWQSQQKQWRDLILSYCQHHHIYRLHLQQVTAPGSGSPLFENTRIKRKTNYVIYKAIL